MAKSFKTLKKTVGSSSNSRLSTSKDKKKAFKDIKVSDYDFSLVKSTLEDKIRLDTLGEDLSSMGKTIEDVRGNWQTQETMNNTRTTVESMQNRLRAYKEYSHLFGGADVSKNASKLVESYGSVLDGWGDLSKIYGNYNNADAFNVAKRNTQLSEQFKGLSYDEVQTEKKKHKPDSDEYKFLDTYTGYTDLNDFNKALESGVSKDVRDALKKYDDKIKNIQGQAINIRNPSAVNTFKKALEDAKKEKEAYIKSLGYENEDAFNKHLSYTDSVETARNKHKLDHTFDLYKDVMQNEDFAEKSKYVSTEGKFDNWWDKFTNGQYGLGYGDLTYEYINNADMRDEINRKHSAYASDTKKSLSFVGSGYDKLNPEEIATYNYIYNTEGENKAQAFLEEMEVTLTKRVYDEQTKRWEDAVDNPFGAFAHSALSIPASVYGSIPTLVDTAKDFVQGKEYNPYSSAKVLSNYASDTRKYVSENIAEATEGLEVFGQNVPSFLYSTGMSIADNLLGASTLQKAYLPLMATNAFHQKAKEMTEAGEDTATIYKTALASGAAEMVFEKFSLDHFLKIKNVDGIGKIITNTLKQAGIEGSEEIATELSNIITDSVIRGNNSELAQKYQELIERGFSEKEANIEIAKHIGGQVTWAGIGGALSGGALGSVGALGNYIDNSSTGKTIKSNERVADLFDIASTSPEISSAYETYTRYANKGINADNITNAQLGNLYSTAKAEAVDTFNSKKTTAEQKTEAMKTLARLSTVETENTVKKEAKKDFNIGEETKVTKSGAEVDVKDLKIKGNEVALATDKGEISVDDVTLTQNDAELVVLAKGIAETDGEDVANLFLNQYDGKTNAEEYANSFNLTVAYAKNDFTYDTILKNKGVLSTDQVNAIYAETIIKADKEAQNTINKLNEKMANTMTYKGFIEDSAITDEVWGKLDTRQRQAVTFIKGFAQATGMNLVLTHNPLSKHGGAFAVTDNTITIDVAKYKHIQKGLMETIIPTMSHETTHWMEEKAPELWRNMNKLVFSTLQEADGIDEVTRIGIEQARLKEKGREGTEKEARSEIIARACEDMLSMSEQGKKMFNSLSESEQKNLVDKIKELIQNLKDWVSELLGTYKSGSYEAQLMRQYEEKLNRLSKLWDEMLVKSVEANQSLEKSGAFEHDITSIGTRNLNELSDAVGIDGESLFQYRAMVEDEDIYREMLLKHKDTIGITDNQITELFDTIDKAVDIISNNLEALDYAWDSDIDDRAFSPIKPNSDTLYKVSLDFSTLCRKRLLQQTIQSTLQQALNKNLSKEESIAIRDELIKIQEKGRKIEVACALCYVESARMKSPKQINKFLNNREDIIREFFANKSGGSIKEKIANAELKARKKLQKDNPNGLVGKNGVILDALTAPKSKMTKADADYIRAEGRKVKESYKLTEHEQAELDVTRKMNADDFTSAKGLENLAKKHPDLFDAYTSFVRNATHSKGIENDTWWRAGDSNAIGDNLIAQMNAENGLRSQSWSDFQVIHLLDYIAATIELSTKGAKRQSYTKVPDYVKLLGNTGDMINMCLIPERVFDGKLSYDGVEGMAYDIAKQLRDEYHETVGTICIGIENEQIRLLLEDNTIDMVIPYHHSSMSKATRKLMHIPTWVTYEKSQNESKLSDADAKANAEKYGVEIKKDNMYQKSPNFSEWFNLEEARQIAKLENEHPSDMDAYKKYGKMYGGYMAMQNAANNYLKLCAERGLSPKFSSKDADFTKDANYWKLLTDRKMVDNVTGEIIEQKPIKPIFNEKHILEILNDELARYPQVKADQEYAQRKVVEKFLSGEMNVDQSTLDAIKKPIDNVTEVNILESSRDGVLNSNRDTEYLEPAKNPEKNEKRLHERLTENDIEEYIKAGSRKNNSKKKALEDGKKIILVTEDEITSFIHQSIIGNDSLNTVGYGRVNDRLYRDVITYSDGKINIKGSFLELVPNDIQHAYEEHLNAKEEGDIGLSIEDFENIPSYIEHYDDIVYAIRYKSGNTRICLSKKLPKGRVLIIETVSKSRGSVAFKNMIGVSEEKYINQYEKKYKKRDTSNTRGGINPNISLRDENVSTSIIHDSKQNVKELFSDRDDTSVYDTMGETERIKKENEKFKADIERLKERLKIERQVTHGNYFNENQLGTVAGHLRNISSSIIDKAELMNKLKDVYSFIAQSENLAWEDVFERCYNIADAMLQEAKPKVMVDDYYKRILRDIREAKISLSESQKKEAQHIFGKNWNRYFFGKIIISDKGIPIDSKWQEWSSMYPGFFDTDISDADMIVRLYDIYNSLRDASETITEYDTEEEARWLAREIYNQYWNVSPIRTTADKYDRQIRLLNFEHRRIMTEFREEYNSRLKEQRKSDKERYKKLVDKIRERKDNEIALAKEKGKERIDKYKENAERKTRIQSITSNSLSLNELLVKNSKDKHVPEIMREPVTALLQAINFSSKRMLNKGVPTQKDISLSKALSKVKDMMVKATNAHDELVELYGHGMDEDIEKMVDSVDNIMRNVGDNEFIINEMTLTDLQTLDKMVKTIRHAVNKLNKFHTVNHARGIANLSQESVLYLDGLGKGKIYDGKKGAIKKLLDWGNALPYYVFKRFGNGGMKVYEALQDGWDKFAFNIKKIIDFTNDAYTSKEVKEWSEEVKTFKILIPTRESELSSENHTPQYQEVQLTIPQIMSMYCLNKREQARGHLFQGGIRVADFKDKKGNVISQSEGIVFTEADVRNILDSLTDRQKAVADTLQEFMNTVCTDWGNDVSMARFGYKAFGEENYFPIQSDKNNLAVNDETEQPNSLFKLLNMSFTKSTIEKANNRIVISDIFDIFAQHTSDMAKYNALALPVLDSFKWYNYTEKQDLAEGTFKTSGVKQSIEKAFGKDGQNYFTTFLKDINGQQEVSRDTFGKGFFSNAKIAAVGLNLRVVLLQPTSYSRASAIIDNKYLMKALVHKPKIKRAETHCGIALWKSLGYYDTNIQRGVEAQIKHNDTWKDKATDWSMKGAEWADKVTWGYLWNACELEVRDKRKDLKVGSEEFYTEIGKRLREVIYATQVVDSTMTRSQMMRSGDGMDKILTAFASEPTLSYNMLQDAYMGLQLDARSMGKKEAWKKNGKTMARIVVAYTMTNAIAALVESGFDALRDDDDEEMDLGEFMKLYLANFASDMSITGKIPYIKEFQSAIKGFGLSRTDAQWMEEMTNAIKTWYKIFNEGKGKPATAIKYSIKAISDLSGLAFYNLYRDIMATLNKLDLFTADDLNEMFEDFLD